MVNRSHIVAYLAKLLHTSLKLRIDALNLDADEPLFGGRLSLDSVDAAQWVATIEQHFRIRLSDEDLLAGALNSLGAMADVLIRRGIDPNRQATDQ